MRKIFFFFAFVLVQNVSNAQFSFKDITSALKSDARNESLRDSINNITLSNTLTYKKIKTSLEKEIEDSNLIYSQRRIAVLNDNSIKNKKEAIEIINRAQDSIEAYKKNVIAQARYWEKYYRFKNKRFFPAYFSSHSIAFFEGDSVHTKLFQNNLVNYNPKTKKMTLYTEAVNDYLGPVRVGIGFQIKSESKIDSLSTTDSTIKEEKKADVLSDLQNGGGDISVNLKFPIFKNKNKETLIQSKFYLYANTGFSLPVLNKAADDFIFNYNLGVEGAVYIKGFNERITFFGQFKWGYFNGNENYEKVITDANKDNPTSFGMLQSSFGFDFMDGYRFRVDLFSGGDFVKNNFPTTITFIVRPGNQKATK